MTYVPRDRLDPADGRTPGPAEAPRDDGEPSSGAQAGNGAKLANTRSADEIQARLADTDLDMIRVLEDLITVLIDKRIIMLTDLPPAAQGKLAKRYQLRSNLNDLGGIVTEGEEFLLP